MRNFGLIADETYRVSSVHWIRKDREYAAYLFDFDRTGLIDGKPASGGGIGMCVPIKADTSWQLLVEHLGPRA